MQGATPDWLAVMRAEFLEMPDMRLTVAQALRLWGLDRAKCGHLLERLTSTGFLERTADGSYRRADAGS